MTTKIEAPEVAAICIHWMISGFPPPPPPVIRLVSAPPPPPPPPVIVRNKAVTPVGTTKVPLLTNAVLWIVPTLGDPDDQDIASSTCRTCRRRPSLPSSATTTCA